MELEELACFESVGEVDGEDGFKCNIDACLRLVGFYIGDGLFARCKKPFGLFGEGAKGFYAVCFGVDFAVGNILKCNVRR